MSWWIRFFFFCALVWPMACQRSSGGKVEECNYADDDWNGIIDDSFVDEHGRYHTTAHCGGCGIDCEQVLPTAAQVSCSLESGEPICLAVSCAAGYHLVSASLCAPDLISSCAPCTDNADCQRLEPTAACVRLSDGQRRCAPPCSPESASDCALGFICDSGQDDGRCVPASGTCSCTVAEAGSILACWVSDPTGRKLCPGEQLCDGQSLRPCEPAVEEICDGDDNNCDGATDEGFLSDGLYTSTEHCGACNHPCTPLGPQTAASCQLVAHEPTCVRDCDGGWIDLDGIALNGCECQRADAVWPPLALGGDMDCDGTVDSTTEFIFVSVAGRDSNPGTLDLPVRTIHRGLSLAGANRTTILVAEGSFDEAVTLVSGVALFGGYRADFGARDPALYPSIIQHRSGPAGTPALVAEDIVKTTEVAGFTVLGTDASLTGQGTTAAVLRNCGALLEIHHLRVVAGRGADGRAGTSGSERLDALGYDIPDLDGNSGGSGNGGFYTGAYTCSAQQANGGSGGAKSCPWSGAPVSGGRGGHSACPNTGCSIGRPCPNSGCSDYTVNGECDFDYVLDHAVPCPSAAPGQGPAGGSGGALTYHAATTRSGNGFCDDNPTLQREGGGGEDGGSGENGEAGPGCGLAGFSFDVDSYLWRSGDGVAGQDGVDGSGGGGGTQGNGYDALWGSGADGDHLGGAGGGGGAGGCGAPSGTGGQGGGGSIALLVVLRDNGVGPNLHDLSLAPGRAGRGGDGGAGASGGAPGSGGLGGDGNFWCARRGGKGGNGGRGGDGGGGGGGCGGSVSGLHILAANRAAGLTYLAGVDSASLAIESLPTPAVGGRGGTSPTNPGGDGTSGDAVKGRVVVPLAHL